MSERSGGSARDDQSADEGARPSEPVKRRRASRLTRAVEGSVVVMTGASSGIGRTTALRLGSAGATVVLVARRREELEAVAQAVRAEGGTASVHPCDLTDLDAVAALGEAVLAEHGRVDVLVNNAGRSIRRGIDHSYERIHDFERTMQLNYLGAVQLTLAFLPGMRERKRGHIVNVSSIAVQAGAPRFASYVASKAALDAFARCVAAEVRHDGVRFTTVHMPLVRTAMIAPTKLYDLAPAISSERAASMVCDAIIRRPNEVGTAPGSLVAMGNRLAPRTMNLARNAAYRVLPD
jgi:NAD(P)-dependent dehydrogenase (short-subunit alcohol dehydrogenase family)